MYRGGQKKYVYKNIFMFTVKTLKLHYILSYSKYSKYSKTNFCSQPTLATRFQDVGGYIYTGVYVV